MNKSMRSIAASMALAAGLLAPLALASPAEANTPGCVTLKEFRGAEKGWNIDRVHNRFDDRGRLSFKSGPYKDREYRPCKKPGSSYMSVSYFKNRLDSKTYYSF